MMIMRGLFIVFEGLDRCGKTTQATELMNKLNDKSVEFCFPKRDTSLGVTIDKYLKDKILIKTPQEMHLIFSANRWECQKKIKEYLDSGVNVICSRYFLSGIVYSMANGLSFDFAFNSEVGLIKPDIVFYLDVSPEEASLRDEYGVERYENIDFQKNVFKNFENVIESLKDEFNFFKIDAHKSPTYISKIILFEFKKFKLHNNSQDIHYIKKLK